MGDRGSQPETNIKALPAPRQQRPMPARGMGEGARYVWMKTVNAYPADFFKPQHLGLLRMYCEADALAKHAQNEARKVNFTDTNPKTLINKPSHWVNIKSQAVSEALALSTKLGLNKNSTIAGRTKDGGGKNEQPKSKFDGLVKRGQ